LTTAFRVAEINSILKRFETALVYSTFPDRDVFQRYAAAYPQFGTRVRRFHPLRRLKGSAAYVIFLNNIYGYVEYLEEAGLPFAFELYPGGGFNLDDAVSDGRLRRVFGSPMFRKVIVTQTVTREYLLEKKFCRTDDIELIYGLVVLSQLLNQMPIIKTYYGLTKQTLDICFVANKYMSRGEDKGYDRFIACARILCASHHEARFHVVGNFDEFDVDIGDLRGRITFYGRQLTSFFPKFYSRMDLILSPNVPFVLAPGAFDGFPTGCCIEAALCGTAVFATDELHMNDGRLRQGEDIVIIPRQPEEIASVVETHIADPRRLASIAERGQSVIRTLFNLDAQMVPRIRVLSELSAHPGTALARGSMIHDSLIPGSP
jgi:glycosyltransferase involved in cell wall biosynthesis